MPAKSGSGKFLQKNSDASKEPTILLSRRTFFPDFNSDRYLTVGMNQDFKILIEFLDQFGVEAAGRELPEPKTETAVLLERFARGECSQEERAEVCRMLRLHPAWLRWLADRVKLARESAGNEPAAV
jgi:hypothetical protein